MSKNNNTIQDFGEKIGGARKDLYALGNLSELNDAELSAVTRDKIWKRPNIQKLLDAGTDRILLFWREQVRKAIPTKPTYSRDYETEELYKAYIRIVNRIKEFVETAEEVDQDGLKEIVNEIFELDRYAIRSKNVEGASVYTANLWNLSKKDEDSLTRLANRERFGKTADEKLEEDVRKNYFFAKYLGVFDERPTDTTGNVCYYMRSELDADYHTLHVRSDRISGSYYIYPKREIFDVSGWTTDTYVVFGKGVEAINFSTEEDASAYVDAAVAFLKAAKKDKRKGAKQRFPYQLEHVVQEGGANVKKSVTGENYLETFAFRGGEYGNWMNDNDRQVSLDMGYIAFHNLASVLGIDDGDISLGGKLAIAFGARGHSAARAHFEPDRNVINLTKMNGAGAVAHEWGHALDAYLGAYAEGNTKMYSEQDHRKRTNSIEVLDELLDVMKYRQVEEEVNLKEKYENAVVKCRRYLETWISRFQGEDLEEAKGIIEDILQNPPVFMETEDKNMQRLSDLRKRVFNHKIPRSDRETIANNLAATVGVAKSDLDEYGETKIVTRKAKTDYLTGSEVFDATFAREGGYWSSTVEMFARAFDCYISDKLKEAGIKDTYLCAYANSYGIPGEKDTIRAYPYGEERETLNRLFDRLFEALFREGLLHTRPETEEIAETMEKSVKAGGIAPKMEDAFHGMCAKEAVQMTIFDFL